MDYYRGPSGVNSGSDVDVYKPELDPEPLDTDFRRKYPPEAIGREMDDGARVWKVYRDEATAHDTTTLDGWSKTLDILLIFAGLFSAVATAFVIESYKLLQLDSGAYTANALYVLLNQTNPSSVASLPIPPGLDAKPSSVSRWVNGLWFTSLVIALAVALLCILVKQWIGEYVARNTASARNPREWARRRQLYFQGLARWPVAGLVSVLPVLLHLSLFLFFAGVVCFLWDLDKAIGIWVIVLGLVVTGFYLASTLLPLWHADAPTSTPLVHQSRLALDALKSTLCDYMIVAVALVLRIVNAVSESDLRRRIQQCIPDGLRTRIRWCIGRLSLLRFRRAHRTPRRTMRDRLHTLLARLQNDTTSCRPALTLSHRSDLDADALKWLILSVSDSDAVAVGLQALGACGLDAPWVIALRGHKEIAYMPIQAAIVRSVAPPHAIEMTRAIRATLCIRNHPVNACPDFCCACPQPRHISQLALDKTLYRAKHPDSAMIGAFIRNDLRTMRNRADEWLASSSTLSETAMILFRSYQWEAVSMSLLMCVRLYNLSETHWAAILGNFRSSGSIVEFDEDPRLDETKERCNIAELLCHVGHRICDSPGLPIDAAAWRLFSHVFQYYHVPSPLNHNAAQPILHYLTSEYFLEIPHSRRELNNAVEFLSRFNGTGRNRRHCRKVLQAYPRVLHAAGDVQGVWLVRVASTCHRNFYAGFPRWMPHLKAKPGDDAHRMYSYPYSASSHHYALEQPTATEMLDYLFAPQPEPMNMSLWGLMHTHRSPTEYSAIRHFTDHVATVLCRLWHSGQDVERYVDEFFSWVSLRDIIFSGWDDSMIDESRRILSHCIELQPRWWTDGIDKRMSDSDHHHTRPKNAPTRVYRSLDGKTYARVLEATLTGAALKRAKAGVAELDDSVLTSVSVCCAVVHRTWALRSGSSTVLPRHRRPASVRLRDGCDVFVRF